MATGTTAGPLTMVDPLSGKTLTVDEVGEHMRVQLLDPRYRVEQKRFQDKQRETGFAEGASIAESLKTFAKKRGDIFGEAASAAGAAAEQPKKEVG
jgi:splicing factor 3A subunit 1